jgi:hypothetical protein
MDANPLDSAVLTSSTDTAELCSAIVAAGHGADLDLLIDAWRRIARNEAATSPYELAAYRVGHGPFPAAGETGIRRPLWPAGGYFIDERFDIFEPHQLQPRDMPRRGKSGMLALWRGHPFTLRKSAFTRNVGTNAAKTKKMWAIEPESSVRHISRCYPEDRAQVIVDAAISIASGSTPQPEATAPGPATTPPG